MAGIPPIAYTEYTPVFWAANFLLACNTILAMVAMQTYMGLNQYWLILLLPAQCGVLPIAYTAWMILELIVYVTRRLTSGGSLSLSAGSNRFTMFAGVFILTIVNVMVGISLGLVFVGGMLDIDPSADMGSNANHTAMGWLGPGNLFIIAAMLYGVSNVGPIPLSKTKRE